jgi:putative endonuclease
MFAVYVIRSEQREYWYVGLTDNVDRRVQQHQDGRERTTKPYRPFQLVYSEFF